MASLVRSVVASVRQNGVVGALRRAYEDGTLRALLDGNYLQTKLRHEGAQLVGVDKLGNKYYQKVANTQFGRHRWVEYPNADYNASSVPPEWHGWLHYVTDETPDKLEPLRPQYAKEHSPNRTGLGNDKIYHAKGHVMSPSQRQWQRYEPWQQKTEPLQKTP